MDYGIGVSNRYAFLDQDVEDDPVPETAKKTDKLKVAEAKLKKSGQKTEKQLSLSKGKNKQGSETEINSGGRGRGRGGISTGRGRGGGGSRPDFPEDKENETGFGSAAGTTSRGRGSGRGRGASERRMRDSNIDEPEEPFYEPRGDRDFGGRQRSGGSEFYSRGRGPRGGGGARGGFTRKRDFDRLSGSDKGGTKSVDKREGGGAHNWGTYKDEIEDVADNQIQGEEIQDTERAGELGQGDSSGEVETDGTSPAEDEENLANETVVEIEPKLMTLEEWKAQQQPRSVPTFNIRKPNEGGDPSQWKNLVLKKKEKVQDEDEGYEDEDTLFPQRAGRQKRITDIGFHFGETRDEDRGFRRGFRGGRGSSRGMPLRKDRVGIAEHLPQVPRVDDVNDFPTLGGSLIC